jgi:small neutral amino acid transporter SnatA (MarC family)
LNATVFPAVLVLLLGERVTLAFERIMGVVLAATATKLLLRSVRTRVTTQH